MYRENVGILLRGIKREEVERGQVLASPGSITPHTRFECGVLTLPEGVDTVMPGDTTVVSVELQSPIAMEAGQRFAIREGGKTVGAGVVLRIFM